MVQQFYTTYTSVDLSLHEIFRAKVGKGGIRKIITFAIFCLFIKPFWSKYQ